MSLDPNYLIASLLVSSVGFVLYKFGRRQRRFPYTAIGTVMLIYPYFVTDVRLMLGIALALGGALWSIGRLTSL
jgi:hypothetical protein